MNTKVKVLDHGYVRLVNFLGTDKTIVDAARVSYKSEGKGDEQDRKLLEFLYKNRHTSPFEMCKITFNIKLPIFVMRQLVRHRMQNLNEVSARYTALPEEFYIPKKWRKQDTKNKQGSVDADLFFEADAPLEERNEYTHEQLSKNLELLCRRAYRDYEQMIKLGVAKEMARFCLPVNIYTEIISCWDLKNLMHFFSLRDDPHAQWEHQQFSKAMKQITAELFPWTIAAYEKYKWSINEQT